MRIESAQLTDETTLEFGDFNVVIGGNAVGKTTLLVELYAQATALPRQRWYWVPGNLSYSTDDLAVDFVVLPSKTGHAT